MVLHRILTNDINGINEAIASWNQGLYMRYSECARQFLCYVTQNIGPYVQTLVVFESYI